jgi:hypothetical protein
VLSNTFMFLPDHLRLPKGLRDLNVVFLHMNIHASTICLHQAAVLTAEKNNISQSFVRQSRIRSLMAAEEIANTMRLVSHIDVSNVSTHIAIFQLKLIRNSDEFMDGILSLCCRWSFHPRPEE